MVFRHTMMLTPVPAEFLRKCVTDERTKREQEARELKKEFFQRLVQKAVDAANHGKTSILFEYTMGTVQNDTKVEIPLFWLYKGHITMTYEEMFETVQGLFPGCKITQGQTPLKSTWCLTIDWS